MKKEIVSSKKLSEKIVSDAIVIAVATGVAYLGAFSYQASYLDFFGIPFYFVDITTNKILFITLIGLVGLGYFVMIVDAFLQSEFSDKNKHPIARKLLLLGIVELIVFGPMAILLYDQNDWTSLIKIAIVIICCLALPILAYFSIKKSLESKKEEKNNDRGLIEGFRKKFGLLPLLALVIVSVFIMDCGLFGRFSAVSQEEYLVLSNGLTLAVISTYEGSLIAIAFDPSAHTFLKGITLIDKNELYSNKIFLTLSKIGTLHPLSL